MSDGDTGAAPLLRLWRRSQRWPLAGWLFSRAVRWKAPYFGSIPKWLSPSPSGGRTRSA